MVANAMPGCQIQYAHEAAADSRSYRVDFSKAKTMLPGFRSAWDLEKGILQVIEGVTNSDLEKMEFEEHRYSRISHLKHRLAAGSLDHSLRRAA
jgi:hypothetical protein